MKHVFIFILYACSTVIAQEVPFSRGVSDGSRKPPERVSFSKEQITASKKIKYIIVILQENWSFDSLYGKFPGANGLSNAKTENRVQVDLLGNPYAPLLVSINTETNAPYSQIPANLPNGPYDLAPYLPMTVSTADLIHDFYLEQYQINGGLMNRFAAFSDSGGFAMSTYDASTSPMGQIAKQYVLCDNWFHSCYGGSMCGVIWLFAGQMPVWPNAPEKFVAQLLPSGALLQDGLVSSDGYLINDAQPFYVPFAKGTADLERAPAQTNKTIGDSLSQKGISWGWYAQGWDNALAGKPDKFFAFHHQAPVYFKQFAPGTAERQKHLFDLEKFYVHLNSKQMPSVSFIRSLDSVSEHPGDGSLMDGHRWCANLIKKIQQSPIWKECAIIVTYDENGGRWDHVAPPVVDRFGPATRVPAMIISPFAKKGFIDHTSYETVSVLKFIEERFDLAPLSSRDAAANNILNAFDFSQ